MRSKVKPEIRCWIKLIDPETGEVVKRIQAKVVSELKEEREVEKER